MDALLERANKEVDFWFHSMPLPGGSTKGNKSVEQLGNEIDLWQFPKDLTGKTVLDIGCADGYWTVMAKERGAKSVISIDEQMTNGLRWLINEKVFPIEFKLVDVLSPEFLTLGSFDFVIFAGVLYHTRNPLEALTRVRRATRELAIIESHLNETYGRGLPYAVFYETTECNNDPTNWWGPNLPCIEAMMRSAGFRRYEMTGLLSDHPGNRRVSFLAYP